MSSAEITSDKSTFSLPILIGEKQCGRASFSSTAFRPADIVQTSYMVWVSLRLLLTLHGAEEVLQFLEGFLGTFFLQEMAAIETAPGYR
ncbi:MAG: hypothetical protein ABR973_01975 [Candidatus Acidiferrales bacterium]|jgi:hypothetical protein